MSGRRPRSSASIRASAKERFPPAESPPSTSLCAGTPAAPADHQFQIWPHHGAPPENDVPAYAGNAASPPSCRRRQRTRAPALVRIEVTEHEAAAMEVQHGASDLASSGGNQRFDRTAPARDHHTLRLRDGRQFAREPASLRPALLARPGDSTTVGSSTVGPSRMRRSRKSASAAQSAHKRVAACEQHSGDVFALRGEPRSTVLADQSTYGRGRVTCQDHGGSAPAPSRLYFTYFSCKRLEREKGFEPSTPTLARLCSTPELLPRADRPTASEVAALCQRTPATQP